MNSSKLLVIYICLTLIYLPGYHSLFAQCNENIIINPGFEIVGPPCGPVGNLINGAFNQNCIVGWQAAWGTPSVCGFNPHSGNNMSCFGANNEGCYQNLPLCTGAIYNLSFYYLNINGNTGNLKVYLANGLINQPMGNNGNPPLVIQPGWQLLASLPVTNSTWTLGVVPAFTVNDPTNTQLLFLDMPITNLDIGIDDVVLNTTNMMPGMNVQIDINCNPTGPMYTWMASISNLPAGWTAVNFNWDFGDGTSGYGPIVNHTFPAFGIYTVCLSVVDNCGCATQACMTIDYNPCSCKCGVDTEPPIVLNAPVTPVEVSCEQDIPMAGVLMVIDSCDASPIIQFNEAISGSSCNRTITRQWIITDQCGNSSMVSQLIHLYDDTPPLFINPPLSYIEVSCLNDIPAPPAVIAVDECDIVAMVEFNESSSGQPCNMMIERIWTTTDPCGNSATISQVILMFDNTPPTVENAPLSFVEVHCLADIPPPEILIANDECNLVPEINFYETSSGPLCNQIIERTWTIEDLCGNSNIITQTIFMIDTTPPAFSPAPANIVIECPYTITDFLDWVSDYGGGVATDDCGTVFWDVQYDELPQGNCVSIPVNFIVTDLCGNSSVRTAFFNTNDSSTPAIIQPPVDLVFNCEPVNVNDILDWLSFNGGAIAQDPCAALSWTNDFDWDLTQDTVEINFMVADVCMHSVSTSAFIIQSNDSDTVLISSVTCDETLAGFDTVVVQNGSCIFMTVNQILFHPPDTTVFYSITCDLLQAGSDIIHLQNQYGCDSLVIQNRVFEPTDTIFQMTTTCSPANVGSDTTVYAGQLCDSMVIVITDILASDQTYLSFATCDSTLAGADTIFLTNHYGCDSLVIIVTIYTGGLTIVDEFTSLCGNGVSFQDSMVVPGNPCDSLVITHFSFTPLDTIFHEEFTCDPSGVGTFENTVPGKQGCDSTTFTTLVYSPPDSISIIEHNCFGLDTFIESVVYNNQYGCDSLYVIYYTYNVAPDTQFVQQVTCDSFQTGIETITLPGEFCDTVMIIKTSFMAVSTSSDTLIVCGKQGKDVDSLIFNTGAGCDSILIRHYQYIDIKSEISITDESCKSIGDGTIQINSIEGGLPPYVVSLNNGAWQENLSFNSIAPGFYSVFIRDMNGCIDSMSQLEIQAGQDFNVNIGSDIKAKAGDLVNLSVVSNELIASMLWVSVDSLTCNACPNPVLGPLTVGQLLSFHAISELGCPGFDELDIRVEDDLLLYIPNSFSPNEDGINDVFYASGHYFGSMAYRMTIFDRWGNMVYHNDNLTIGDSSSGWNGIFKDQPVAPGVYIYVLGLHLPEKVDKWYTGDITLIR